MLGRKAQGPRAPRIDKIVSQPKSESMPWKSPFICCICKLTPLPYGTMHRRHAGGNYPPAEIGESFNENIRRAIGPAIGLPNAPSAYFRWHAAGSHAGR